MTAPAGDPRNVYVGLMSGTSQDGISAAVVRFAGNGQLAVELLASMTIPYSDAQRADLRQATEGAAPAAFFARLDFDLGSWLASAAVQVMAEAGVARDEIRAIGSHGHTVWHEPPDVTWQLGESAIIAERTGIDVVSDFRVRDVAAGGEGAPLVPIADALLFADNVAWRVLLNVGGMANVTIVPPGGDLTGVRGFDTGPGVAVIDGVVRMLDPGARFDVDGAMALAGMPDMALVTELASDPFFKADPPKSTGRERFDQAYVEWLVAECRRRRDGCSDADIVATATALTAVTIADALHRFAPEPIEQLLVSGGGARNRALVAMLVERVTPIAVRQFSDVYFDGEAKEAVAFALLAHLHVTGTPGNVPRVTGARGLRVLGKLTPA